MALPHMNDAVTASRLLVGLVAALALGACATDDALDEETRALDDTVTVDTSTARARAQYDAEVAFATHYTPSCTTPAHGRPRVLVSGFGRFRDVLDNASGRIVASLGGFAYPETTPPKAGKIDPPGPQLAVDARVLTLPGAGEVDLCAIVLPVVWDLAPILLLKELEAFQPDLVIMNGVADPTQPLWIELGAINQAVRLDDGTGVLEPATNAIIAGAAHTRKNLLSWDAVRAAARRSRNETAADDAGFGDILTGVKEQAPRVSSSYLCNNLTYVTGYLMDAAAGTKVPLLVASDPVAGETNKVVMTLDRRYKTTPRVFFHWPTKLTSAHGIKGGVALLREVIDAQLTTAAPPTRGEF
ncbi:MAG: hypothetical protein QM820_34800 [Minicystis sp.]